MGFLKDRSKLENCNLGVADSPSWDTSDHGALPHQPRQARWSLRRGSLAALSVVAVTLSTILGCSVTPVAADAAPASPRSVAVIDAGSSGSRIALYERAVTTGRAPTILFQAKPPVPALSSFASDPTHAGPKGIAPLLTDLSAYLHKHEIAHTEVPVAVLATAGMRLLNESDPQTAARIFASVGETVTAAGFQARRVGLLSGSDEALDAWIDVNALQGHLAVSHHTTGIVEVGGASAQVAFQTSLPHGDGIRTVRLSGRLLHVVAVSYLGLGSNEARASMARTSGGASRCYPNNPSGVAPEFFTVSPALSLNSSTAHFALPRCLSKLARVIAATVANASNRKENSGLTPRRLHGVKGFSTTEFATVAGAMRAMRDFSVSPTGDERSELRSSLGAHCAGHDAWGKVVGLFHGSTGTFSQTACADATFIFSILFGPTGIDVQPSRLVGLPDFGDTSPSWSRGYAVTVIG